VYRGFATDQGLEVYESLDELGGQRLERFDLISLAHVLEHIPEPRDFLQNLRDQWLNAEGLLLVEVPNLFYHHCFELPHLSSYYSSSLSRMLATSGFQEVFSTSHGYPRSRRIPLYLVSIASPQKDLGAEHRFRVNVNWIRLRRQFGRLSYKAAAMMISMIRGSDAMELDRYYERIASEAEQLDE
jgi:2-polyprenyl-3-methyl-5-hydroxy-6-metoxy-1,4-benzoquinol methylase